MNLKPKVVMTALLANTMPEAVTMFSKPYTTGFHTSRRRRPMAAATAAPPPPRVLLLPADRGNRRTLPANQARVPLKVDQHLSAACSNVAYAHHLERCLTLLQCGAAARIGI